MDYSEFLGYKVQDVCHILDINNIEYKIKEIWDTRKIKMGNDCRVVKIIKSDIIVLIAAFF